MLSLPPWSEDDLITKSSTARCSGQSPINNKNHRKMMLTINHKVKTIVLFTRCSLGHHQATSPVVSTNSLVCLASDPPLCYHEHKTPHTREVAQRHAQCIRLLFAIPARWGQPLTINRRWPRDNLLLLPTTPPSSNRLGVVLSKSNKNSTGNHDLQVPLDAITKQMH